MLQIPTSAPRQSDPECVSYSCQHRSPQAQDCHARLSRHPSRFYVLWNNSKLVRKYNYVINPVVDCLGRDDLDEVLHEVQVVTDVSQTRWSRRE